MDKYFLCKYKPELKLKFPHKTICIVSNKLDLKRNYSKFVDSCDCVVRTGKACNINTGLTGSKLDIMGLSLPPLYWTFSEERRHIKEIRERAKVLLFLGIYFQQRDFFTKSQNILGKQIEQLKPLPLKDYGHFCAVTSTLFYITACFPKSKIYFLGDVDTEVRIADSWNPNHMGQEDWILKDLIDRGKVIHILEDNKTEDFKYSEPIV